MTGGCCIRRCVSLVPMLSDEELAAVVVYLRSLPPVRNPLPKTVLSEEQIKRYVSAPQPITVPVPPPPQATPAERGRYLATVADCTGCHTSGTANAWRARTPSGNEVGRNDRIVFSANITPDASGMPYDAAGFIQVIRTGKSGLPIRSCVGVLRRLDDADLTALHAFLRTRHPVAHRISNLGEKSQCAVCDRNTAWARSTRWRNCAAWPCRQRCCASTWALTHRRVRLDDPRRTCPLQAPAIEGDGKPKELVPLSDTLFAKGGSAAAIRAHAGSIAPEASNTISRHEVAPQIRLLAHGRCRTTRAATAS